MPPLSQSDFKHEMPSLLRILQRLVELESPTTAKDRLDLLGYFVAAEIEQIGGQVRLFPQEKAGDHLLGQWGSGENSVLLLTHLDTVHPLGSLDDMPWRRTPQAVYGPGVLDMKASVAMALTALRALREAGKLPPAVSLLCTSDEETGSRTSRELIEGLASNASIVLCLEPALPDGGLKTWRKGILGFRLDVEGASAHAGSDIRNGVNAILEMSHQIQAVTALADEQTETTVSVGVIAGGTRSNVVPQSCWSRIDVRAKTVAEGERIIKEMQSLKPVLPGAVLHVRGGWNRPPMERDDQMQTAFQHAEVIAGSLEMTLSEGGTGGGSDANFVARLGVPVLDGLGALGRGAHTQDELVELETLADRTALLAALISEW
jgi:glutamate carboxypeptidase